ncbi:hypothetical protein CN918_28860 [Priestia megaterium]|nr:hypothetical protein CN918_28860 [Priestia megaterium]
MILLADEVVKELEEGYIGLKVRRDKVLFKGNGVNITTPSKLYPLSNKNKIQLFSYANTEPLEDENIKKIFDNMSFRQGFCYQNTRDIYNALTKDGVTDLQPYVGWVFSGKEPIHHCWLVHKDKYVIDGSMGQQELEFRELSLKKLQEEDRHIPIEEAREMMANFLVEKGKLPHSETKTFGQAVSMYVYVGTPCSPEDGRKIFQDLTASYPNHPAYAADGMNQNGASKVQKMVKEKLRTR